MNNAPFEVSITGIWCGNGVVRAKKAILAVPGVTAVKVDLARSVATVYGAFDQAAVIGMVNEIVLDGAAKLEAANRNSGKICG